MAYPGPQSARLIEELGHYVIADPYPFVLDLEKSSGMWLATIDGQSIFDWAGYYGSKLVGHNHPATLEQSYLMRLARAANNKVANPDFLTQECIEYYRLLYRIAPLCMRNPKLEVYAVNSGAEAVENVMKYMINLYDEKLKARGKTPGTRRFIYFDQAFHGRTVFALNVTQLTHNPIATKNFQGIIPGNIQVPFPSIDTSQPASRNENRTAESLAIVKECLEKYGDEVVGIVVEPIQGAGGHRMASADFYRGLSQLAHDFDVFLGFDEVQTAGGQTGTIFAIDQYNLPFPPQAVAVAKKFGNGAVYMLYPMEDKGVLDSTWGGNLADMVRFVKEWEIIEKEKLIEQVPEKTARLTGGLQSLVEDFKELVFNVRGLGLYQGFTFRTKELKKHFISISLEQQNLLVLEAGSQTVRLRPPLTVTLEEIDEFLKRLERCFLKLRSL